MKIWSSMHKGVAWYPCSMSATVSFPLTSFSVQAIIVAGYKRSSTWNLTLNWFSFFILLCVDRMTGALFKKHNMTWCNTTTGYDTFQNYLVVVFGFVFRKLFLWEPETFVWRELKIFCPSFSTEWAGEPGALHGVPGFWGCHLLPDSLLPPSSQLRRSPVVVLTCWRTVLPNAFLIRVWCFLRT